VPELRHLRAFVAVAQERNFTRAAARLHLAQQAVSKSVAQLERELGVALLRRTTREVTLTEVGEALLRDAVPLLIQAGGAFARTQAVGRQPASTVRVGVTPAVSAEEVNALVRVIQTRGHADVAVFDVRPGRIARALADQTLHLALLRTAPPRHTGGLQRLASVPIGVAVDTGHRLAILNSVRWADLDHENLLVWNPPGTPYTDLLLTLTAKHDVHLTAVRSTVVGGHGLPDVAQGRGIALVPAFQPTTAGVRVVPLDSTATLPLLAAWNEPVGALTHSERKHLQSLLAEAGNARRAAP